MPGPYLISRASAAAATAVNTAQAATNDSLAVASGAIQVPNDISAITAVEGAFTVSTWTATSVGTTFHIRLTGNGVPITQDLAVGGLSSITSTTGAGVAVLAFSLPLAQYGIAMPVIRGNLINVSFFQCGGVSVGTWSGEVTFTFQ